MNNIKCGTCALALQYQQAAERVEMLRVPCLRDALVFFFVCNLFCLLRDA